MMKVWKNLFKGLIRENPVLVLLLGTCPTLAVTTSVKNALGMGIAATAVLICSNVGKNICINGYLNEKSFRNISILCRRR